MLFKSAFLPDATAEASDRNADLKMRSAHIRRQRCFDFSNRIAQGALQYDYLL